MQKFYSQATVGSNSLYVSAVSDDYYEDEYRKKKKAALAVAAVVA